MKTTKQPLPIDFPIARPVVESNIVTMKCGVRLNKASPLNWEAAAFVLALSMPISKILLAMHTSFLAGEHEKVAVYRCAMEFLNPNRTVDFVDA